jgi:TetR/AcrR family fatty acid metabolism transcriptional regulator
VINTSEKFSPHQLEIINANRKLLTQKGSSGLTIIKLAKSIKFSESMLYRHYKSAEAKVVSLLEFVESKLNKYFSEMDKTK